MQFRLGCVHASCLIECKTSCCCKKENQTPAPGLCSISIICLIDLKLGFTGPSLPAYVLARIYFMDAASAILVLSVFLFF